MKDVTGEKDPSPRIYQRFKRMVVALLPHDTWTLTETGIKEVLDLIEREHAQHAQEV